MKKIFKIVALLTAILIVSTVFSSCAKNENGKTTGKKNVSDQGKIPNEKKTSEEDKIEEFLLIFFDAFTKEYSTPEERVIALNEFTVPDSKAFQENQEIISNADNFRDTFYQATADEELADELTNVIYKYLPSGIQFEINEITANGEEAEVSVTMENFDDSTLNIEEILNSSDSVEDFEENLKTAIEKCDTTNSEKIICLEKTDSGWLITKLINKNSV